MKRRTKHWKKSCCVGWWFITQPSYQYDQKAIQKNQLVTNILRKSMNFELKKLINPLSAVLVKDAKCLHTKLNTTSHNKWVKMFQTICVYDYVFQLSFQYPLIGTEKWYQIVCSIVSFSIRFVSMAYSSSADSIRCHARSFLFYSLYY